MMTEDQIEARVQQLMDETREVVMGYHLRYLDAFSLFDIMVSGDHDGNYAAVICHYHVVDICDSMVAGIVPSDLDDEEYFRNTATNLMLVLTAPIRKNAMRALFPEEYHAALPD